MSDEPIISIDEFRRITGFASSDMDDSTIKDAISRLDLIAGFYTKQAGQKQTSEQVFETPPSLIASVSPPADNRGRI